MKHLTPQQAAALIKAKSGNQAYLNAVAVSVPRGPNPYACPHMGDYTETLVNFTRPMAERFFAPVIWGYVRAAIIAGSQGYQIPWAFFGNMVTGNGALWQGFDTAPIPLPVNDHLYAGSTSVKVGAPVTPSRGATLKGLGSAPVLVTIPGTSIKGYHTSKGYVVPGNTNGNPVDIFNWIWWAYVNGKVTCSKAWGSSPNLKTWGAAFKPYSSVIDKMAPGLIETAVIAGTTYGMASGIASMGAAASSGGEAGAGAASGGGTLAPTEVTAAAPTGETAGTLSTTSLTAGGAVPLAPVAAPTGAVVAGSGVTAGSVISTVTAGTSAAKAVLGVAAATGLIAAGAKGMPGSLTANTKLPLTGKAPVGSPASTSVFHYLAPIGLALGGLFALFH